MKNNVNWWMIIIVTIVVAVIASLITVNLTNNNPNLSPIYTSDSNLNLTGFSSSLSFDKNGNHAVTTPGNLFLLSNSNGDTSYTDLFLMADPKGSGYGGININAGKGTGIFVKNGNNVGIGTTNPQAKLDVDGSIKSSDLTINDNSLTFNKGVFLTSVLSNDLSYLTEIHSQNYMLRKVVSGGAEADFTSISPGYVIMTSPDRKFWKCGPGNSGAWTCSATQSIY